MRGSPTGKCTDLRRDNAKTASARRISLSLSLCLSEFVVSRIIVHFFLDERRRSRLFVSPKLARAFRQEQRLLFRNWAN